MAVLVLLIVCTSCTQIGEFKVNNQRKNQRPMMLYVSAELFRKIKERGLKNSPPVKPGPVAAEILKYFELSSTGGEQ